MGAIQSTFRRYEKKFILTPEQYEQIVPVIRDNMEPDEFGQYTICNIYYDTALFDLVRRSVEKPIYKEKFRIRSYGVPGEDAAVFAEIKKKYNGVVYKRRVAAPYEDIRGFVDRHEELDKDAQIQKEILSFLRMYRPEPKVYLAYDRIAFAGKNGEDIRVTFDENIRFRTEELDLRAGDEGEPLLPERRIIMEVKVPYGIPMWLVDDLSEHRIYSGSFSKYGTCYQNYIARNLFKSGGYEKLC